MTATVAALNKAILAAWPALLKVRQWPLVLGRNRLVGMVSIQMSSNELGMTKLYLLTLLRTAQHS
jgi:hypothetical protein